MGREFHCFMNIPHQTNQKSKMYLGIGQTMGSFIWGFVTNNVPSNILSNL